MQPQKAQCQTQNTVQPCKWPLLIVSIAQPQYTLLVKVKAATTTDGQTKAIAIAAKAHSRYNGGLYSTKAFSHGLHGTSVLL